MNIDYPEPKGERKIRRWKTKKANSKGLVFFCHGFGLYTDKFETIFPMLNDLGYDVISHDALGHGDSKHPVDYDTIEEIVDETRRVYAQFAHERPILVGIGTFGGFTMRRIIDGIPDGDWVPPAVFYSVEFVNLPMWFLKFVQKPWLQRFLDRWSASYDYLALTHDAEENKRYIEDDPNSTVLFKIGMSLKLAYETNHFFSLPEKIDSPHAFIIGTGDTISHLPPLYKTGVRQPDYRLYEVQDGKMHMHRDKPSVREQFKRCLDDALTFVTTTKTQSERRTAA